MSSNPSNFVVGLTGGIGSGKTTVANLFAELGIELVDTDLIAREIVEPGQPALIQIAEHFGTDLITPDGNLDRAKLRQQVFADPEQRSWLEQLTHPLIRQLTLQRLQQARSNYVILVSPLLLETNQHLLCHHLLIVDVPESVQIDRTVQRDSNSQQQVEAIIAAQCDRQQRLDRADSLIDNTQPQPTLAARVGQLDNEFRALATCHRTAL